MEFNLSEDYKNIHLLLAGTAVDSSVDSKKYLDDINDYVKVNNLNHCIHFIGWRNDIRDIYQNSDIYVSTSYSESFPDAVREAMLASLPVIVTDVGGTKELVKIGKNGYLFEAGNLERANVDITTEMVTMLKTQQAFSGVSRLLQTEVDITKRLIDG